jgi:hypothetical protein
MVAQSLLLITFFFAIEQGHFDLQTVLNTVLDINYMPNKCLLKEYTQFCLPVLVIHCQLRSKNTNLKSSRNRLIF